MHDSVTEFSSPLCGSTGVQAVVRDLIALLDGDDLWDEHKREEQVRAFAAHPQSELVVNDVGDFGIDGVLLPAHLRHYVLD